MKKQVPISRPGYMDKPIRAMLFISYAHSARLHMQEFRKHLEGLLFDKALVWSDQVIARGKKWESELRAHVKHADAALLLVTPEFLASAWCRRELALLVDEQKAGKLKKVFWVQVEPSGWRGTELASFQSWGFNVNEALTEIGEVSARTRAIVGICEDIAKEMNELSAELDTDLLFVRQVIMDQAIDRGLVVETSVGEARGKFWTVCRGRRGAEDVAIKVLRRSMLTKLADSFSRFVDKRKALTNQCFIRVLDHFQADAGHDQYDVLVEEFMGSKVVRLDRYLEERAFGIDDAALVLLRAVRAFQEFHRADRFKGGAYGLLASSHVFYDSRGHNLRLPAVGVSSFLWGALGWERFAAWQDEDERNLAAFVAPEVFERGKGGKPTHQTDQYMLGQLAFEMMERKLPFSVQRPSEVGENKKLFWDKPEDMASGEWVKAHPAFAKIVFKMLKKDPSQRWKDFDELAERLRNVEKENRALAKRTFEGLGDSKFQLKDNHKFFHDFYGEFFRRVPSAKKMFKKTTDQPRQLMGAMAAVLNFHAGNEPTALREIVNAHRHLKISPSEVMEFSEAFLATLRKKLPRSMNAEQKAKIESAWRDLFSPVVEYFVEELGRKSRKPPRKSGRP